VAASRQVARWGAFQGIIGDKESVDRTDSGFVSNLFVVSRVYVSDEPMLCHLCLLVVRVC